MLRSVSVGRSLFRPRRLTLLGVLTAIALFGSAATASAVSYVTWSCTVPPGEWCEFNAPHPYYQNLVTSQATFSVATGSKFDELNGDDYAAAFGNVTGNSSGYAGLYEDVTYLPSGWNLVPLVFNEDTSHSRTFYMTSAW